MPVTLDGIAVGSDGALGAELHGGENPAWKGG
jgi:hypothetical protein